MSESQSQPLSEPRFIRFTPYFPGGRWIGEPNSAIVRTDAVCAVYRDPSGCVSLDVQAAGGGDGGQWSIHAGPQADAVWEWWTAREDVKAFEPDPRPAPAAVDAN